MRALLVLAGLSIGCSFPDVSFGGGPAAGGNGAGSQGGNDGDGGAGAAGGTPPIGGQAACDKDNDGREADGVAGCCQNEVDCDCDDDDANVFPGQTKFFDVPRPGFPNPDVEGAFDYDCDLESEEEFPEGDCTDLAACATSSTDEFFQPALEYKCGAEGRKRFCSGVTCSQPLYTLACQ